MSPELFVDLYGPAPQKGDYPGQKGDIAPNARFQSARNRYEQVRGEVVKVVASLDSDGEIYGEVVGANFNSKQQAQILVAGKVVRKLGETAHVVLRPTDLSQLWLVFSRNGATRFQEYVDGIFIEPRPGWIPLDEAIANPDAATAIAATFVIDSILRGNAWYLAADDLLPLEIRKRNAELIEQARAAVEQLPGLADLPEITDIY